MFALALVNLMFPYDYVEAADSVLSECKIAAENKLKRKNSRLDKCGIPEDQLYLMQQQLIEKVDFMNQLVTSVLHYRKQMVKLTKLFFYKLDSSSLW